MPDVYMLFDEEIDEICMTGEYYYRNFLSAEMAEEFLDQLNMHKEEAEMYAVDVSIDAMLREEFSKLFYLSKNNPNDRDSYE